MPPSGPTPQATCGSRGSARLRGWQEVTGMLQGGWGPAVSPTPGALWFCKVPHAGVRPARDPSTGSLHVIPKF